MGKAKERHVERKFYVTETLVNCDKGYRLGNHTYEADYDTLGGLYKALQREYGRCASKMYIDSKTLGTRQVGWVFVKRAHYETGWGAPKKETYLQETWVQVSVVEKSSPFA